MWWLLAILAFGWFWNGQTNVEGVMVQTAWTVNEVNAPDSYSAKIDLYVPRGANAVIEEQTGNERLRIREDNKLACTSDGFEVAARWRIDSEKSGEGDTVWVRLQADGAEVLAEGKLRSPLELRMFVPTNTPPSCAK
ncbi:MAG: hypothetical protein O3B84_05795 [Chloroflexi bacterium]|nr:hypothetical protein [Chloroflexota bacterium]